MKDGNVYCGARIKRGECSRAEVSATTLGMRFSSDRRAKIGRSTGSIRILGKRKHAYVRMDDPGSVHHSDSSRTR